MSNLARRIRRRHRSRYQRASRTPRTYQLSVCSDLDPDCPVCARLLQQPGAHSEVANGIRIIRFPAESPVTVVTGEYPDGYRDSAADGPDGLVN